MHTPVADVAVTALTMFDSVGVATAIGEQPIKGLIDPKCGARMTVGEALTNLVFAQISDLKVNISFILPLYRVVLFDRYLTSKIKSNLIKVNHQRCYQRFPTCFYKHEAIGISSATATANNASICSSCFM